MRNSFRRQHREWLFVFFLALAVFLALPALANAACQNARAERILLFLLRGTSPESGLGDRLCGSSPSAVELRVTEQLIAGELEQAKSTVERFLAVYPHSSRSRFWAARLIQVAQTPVSASVAGTAFDLAVQIQPNDPLFWYQRGDFYLGQKQPNKAADSYRNGIRVQTENAVDGYLRLGTLFYQLQRMDEALDAFQQAERGESLAPILPNWKEQLLYFYIGEIYRLRQDWASSKGYYQRALDTYRKPGWPTYAVFLGMGDSALAEGDTKGAYPYYASALDFVATETQRAVVYTKLAAWYAEIGETEQALGAYEQAVKLNPNDPWIYFAIARLQERNHQIPQAIANYQKALSINPNLIVIQESLKQLQNQNEDNH